VGLFDWLRRKDTADASISTFTVTTRDASADPPDPERREALEQAERLIHEVLTAGAGEGSAGEGDAGAFVLSAPAQVIVAGQTVSPDDPRALEAMRTAAAKLREHGLDELADELEARAAATSAGVAAPATPPQAPPSAAAPAAAQDAPADGLDAAPIAAADDAADAPSAPAPPEPPSPPS
jgi:hypothetical protein